MDTSQEPVLPPCVGLWPLARPTDLVNPTRRQSTSSFFNRLVSIPPTSPTQSIPSSTYNHPTPCPTRPTAWRIAVLVAVPARHLTPPTQSPSPTRPYPIFVGVPAPTAPRRLASMSVQRRSSSPLSSASPSPLQAPIANGDTALTELNLGPSVGPEPEEDGIIGGSSPTTLTEPLTESELTEDEGEADEEADEEADGPAEEGGVEEAEADGPEDEAIDDVDDDVDEDDGDDVNDIAPRVTKR